jgi:DNA-binding NarL/FixJ family response regulator
MTARAIVVAHRETMVAEGISAALARYPGIVPVGATTAARDAERLGAAAHAVAIDPTLPGASAVAARLRRKGVRVVFLGDARGEEGVRVTTRAPIAALAQALAPEASTGPRFAGRLTSRQREVLGLVAKGMSGKQVARQLGISPKTVERHKTKIFATLGVPNQAAAVFAYGGGMGGNQAWSASRT